MKRLDQLCSTGNFHDIQRRIQRVNSVGDQGTRNTCRKSLLGQPDPHLPVLRITQPGIKRTGLLPCGPPNDNVGTPTRNGVVPQEGDDGLFRTKRWAASKDLTPIANSDAAGIRPVTPERLRRLQLLYELFGSP